ncbi:MAG: 4-(cytidine 5'-diphospho)-2-C-methyl-D-erythritol kinase [bacterium]
MTAADDALSLRGAEAVTLEAQAKVNLRLRVLARETSGYHQIETLFLRLALADTVRIRRTTGARSLDVTFETRTYDIGPVEQNLAWRAAESYCDSSGMRGGFAIELVKRIPAGAGLGGGSADAGAVLRALDALAQASMGEAMLLSLAARLGADVPFLTAAHAYALAWGRGERMLALGAPPERNVTVVVPTVGVNTAEAYGWLAAAAERSPRVPEAHVLDPAGLSEWDGIAPLAENDFQHVVFARHPDLQERADALRQRGARIVMMSGSGSAIFGVHAAGDGDVAAAAPERHGGTDQVFSTRTAVRVERPSRTE